MIITWVVMIGSISLLVVTGILGKLKLEKFKNYEREKKILKLRGLENTREEKNKQLRE